MATKKIIRITIIKRRRDIQMPTEQREQLISLLIIWTGWNESVFENMTDREVAEHYDRYVGD